MENTIPKNIIVRMPNWIGDAVMAEPVLQDLRAHFKESKISVMCQANVADLLIHDPHIDEILKFKGPSDGMPIAPLKRGRFDTGILLTNSFSSAWWFFRGGVKNRIGYSANLRSLLLTRALAYPKEKESEHQVIAYKRLLQPLGIPITETHPRLYTTNEEEIDTLETLKRYGIDKQKHKIVGINPGAAYGSAKCWLPERFRQVTRKLLDDPDVFVLYFGDDKGRPLVQDICNEMPDRVINFAGRTSLRELLCLIKCCDLLLTNDSGPMHIAYAVGTPLLALFGSTSDIKTGPLSGKIIHKRVECSPCYKRVCPIDFRCMTRIEAEEVYGEIKKILYHSI